MDINVLFEDEQLLVIDKPCGVVVNQAESTKTETIQDWILSRVHSSQIFRSTENEEFISRSGIVHRLDKDTSGVLVIAKTALAFENLKNQFKDRRVEKKYVALVHGRVEPESGEVSAPIERNPFNRMHFGVFPGGREAVTKYKVLKYLKFLKYPKETYSYIEVEPKTGRTHQIRVHMKYLNHPIVSDPIYGGRKNLQADLKFCPRLFLHAKSLKIFHPISNEDLEFLSPLPQDLESVLSYP